MNVLHNLNIISPAVTGFVRMAWTGWCIEEGCSVLKTNMVSLMQCLSYCSTTSRLVLIMLELAVKVRLGMITLISVSF